MLQSVFNLAGAISNVYAVLGEDPKKLNGGDITSKAALLALVKGIEADSQQKVLSLEVERKVEIDQLRQTETQLISIGVTKGLSPNSVRVLNP